MNIFVIEQHPDQIAKSQVDSHVCKMTIEYAQMICWAIYHFKEKGGSEDHFLSKYIPKLNPPYKISKSHWNHPCTKWARESLDNLQWLIYLFVKTYEEFTYRRNKGHLTMDKMANMFKDAGLDIFDIPYTEPSSQFALAVGDLEYDNTEDPITVYRKYYNACKQHIARWSKREVPCWYHKV